ncbi:hypothetical protein [Granulicella sibirica]|uniref:4-alpha-glucanotransferase (Amylomaltase) n=1 Tax=Granulicella sibirica TaxID=2479048 RepID=A0A4Q0STM2_9BACT|nr:hypothetical protein [Granulicella sibirica]RXH54027.1 4-alpha-glucanotransferase (amylomaltase) [Granulicella sibirica]
MSKLEQLARVVSLQGVVPTIDGGEQPVKDETKRALLRGLGLKVDDDHEVAAGLLFIPPNYWRGSKPLFSEESSP